MSKPCPMCNKPEHWPYPCQVQSPVGCRVVGCFRVDGHSHDDAESEEQR